MNPFRDDQERKHLLTYVFAGFFIIALYFGFQRASLVLDVVGKFFSIISPFIYGIFIAFMLYPMVSWFKNRALSGFKFKEKTKHVLAIIMTLIVVIEVIVLFFAVLIPQFITSLSSVSLHFPSYFDTFNEFILPYVQPYLSDVSWILDLLDSSSDLVNQLIAILQNYIPNILDFSLKLSQGIINALLSIVIAVYILLDVENLTLQVQRFFEAYLGTKFKEQVLSVSTLTSFMIHRFILGKALNSLIMGVFLYIAMLFAKMDYAIFLSVIFGATNMVPFFGPFIGGAIGVVILFLANPTHAIYFLIFVLVLQNLEGSLLSPILTGDSMGLPGIWIFFAIIVGGGYFGLLGMFLGIPIFAVIYLLIDRDIDARLLKLKDKSFK